MSDWTDRFCEVGYRARLFALALDQHQNGILKNGWMYCYKLAVARVNLECANAVYRVLRAKAIA